MRKDIFSDLPPINNEKIRIEIQCQTKDFLKNGGQIEKVAPGTTGYNKDGSYKNKKPYGVNDGKNSI